MRAPRVLRGTCCRGLAAALLVIRPTRLAAGADFYKVLGITELAEPDEVKKAYRSQSLKFHPDKFQGDPAEAQAMMVKINDAFNCLKNPATRRMYEYYETDYEDMAEYEKELSKKRKKDLYLYDSSVHILWSQNVDKKLGTEVDEKSLDSNTTARPRTWVLNLYSPNDPDCVKQVDEFKRFGRQAEKGQDFRAGAINCGFDGGLCRRFFQLMGRQQIPAFLILSEIQPDEKMATDFEVFDEEKYGFPSARELERQARKVAAHEMFPIDGAFLEQNITRNPLVKEQNVTSTTVWVVWFYHSERCSRVDTCDKTAPGLRKLSAELRGIARVAAINCKKHRRACRGHLSSEASSIRVFLHRQSKHFVESFLLDGGGGADGHQDTMALAGATSILKYLVKPGVELRYPPHPYRTGASTDAAGTKEAEAIDLTKADIGKLRVAQLKEILRSHGESCVGCADKEEFVARVKALAGKKSEL